MNLLGDRTCYFCGMYKATLWTAQDAPICDYCDGFAKRSKVKACRHWKVKDSKCVECGWRV